MASDALSLLIGTHPEKKMQICPSCMDHIYLEHFLKAKLKLS